MSGITFSDYMSTKFYASGTLLLSVESDYDRVDFQVSAESFPDFVMQMVNLGIDISRHSTETISRVKFVILD